MQDASAPRQRPTAAERPHDPAPPASISFHTAVCSRIVVGTGAAQRFRPTPLTNTRLPNCPALPRRCCLERHHSAPVCPISSSGTSYLFCALPANAPVNDLLCKIMYLLSGRCRSFLPTYYKRRRRHIVCGTSTGAEQDVYEKCCLP